MPRISSKKMHELSSRGIESIHDIPDSFSLSEIQSRVKKSVQKDKAIFEATMKKELKHLSYPIYFMDFETINPAVPRHKGMSPYNMLLFQWSVHVMKSRKSKPDHYEFLHDVTSDPREKFITSLLSVLEEHKKAPIVVYNQGFESGRLSELAVFFPKFSKRIDRIKKRLWDLLPVIRKNVYHPDFCGSFSIKNVLPVLIPGMSYKNMKVADGREAGIVYEKMIYDNLSCREKKALKNNLLKYCCQDTLAMVKLLERLQRKCK